MVKDKKFSVAAIIAVIFSAIWILITFCPFLFMVFTSFKEQKDFFSGGTIYEPPRMLYLDNYKEIITGNYLTYLKNSVVVVVLGLVFLLISATMGSYVFARLKFKLNGPLFSIVIACMSIPIHATLIPVFLLSKSVGIYDTPFALLGPYVAFNLPVSVFILTGFMKGIPVELEEAAEIDGCGKIRTFFRVILPLSIPGLATLAIYNGINMWNEFVYALVLLSTVGQRTLPLAIWEYQGQYGMNVPMVMTILSLSVLPMILLFIIFQERLIKGMMAGAVKG